MKLGTIAGWLRPKSRGIRVDRETFRALRVANAARGRGDWTTAATAYHAALAEMPELQHIWVQYAHAAKEAGDPAAAIEGYKRAAVLAPEDPEPHMYLGHLAKRVGGEQPMHHYLNALRRAPDDLDAIREVMQQLLASRPSDIAVIDEILDLLCLDRTTVLSSVVDSTPTDGAVFLDVTDLLSFFSFSRIPSGVQRVQIEIVLALLSAGFDQLALCYYSPAREGWTAIASATFRSLCAASLREDGTSWATELRLVYVASALSRAVNFPKGSVLIGLSAGAPHANYLLHIRTTCARSGSIFVPVIYDLIPVLFPHYFVAAQARDFSAWLHSLLHTARGYVAISSATRDDVLAYARQADVRLVDDDVRVMRLDGDCVKHDRVAPPRGRLADWHLSEGRFVLFVSTIEPRKNHLGAFAAWIKLGRDIGARNLPDLVCVGGRGWLNEDIHAALAREPLLRRKVKLLSGIGDDELDLLYRTCAFTLYPSVYEGWGLPITESLCYGKIPAISSTSSMPEAGGRFAVYYDPHDADAIAAAIRPLILEPAMRATREADIRANYMPRPWLTIGRQLLGEARTIADNDPANDITPTAPLNITISLAAADRIPAGAVNGEIYRFGRGWSSPAADGCLITGPDARLRLMIPTGGARMRVVLRSARTPEHDKHGLTEPQPLSIDLPTTGAADIGLPADDTGGPIVVSFTIEPVEPD